VFRRTYVAYTLLNGDVAYTLLNGDVCNKKCSLDSAAKTIKKIVKSRGKTWTLSRKHSSSRFGGGLAWRMWVLPWLLILMVVNIDGWNRRSDRYGRSITVLR